MPFQNSTCMYCVSSESVYDNQGTSVDYDCDTFMYNDCSARMYHAYSTSCEYSNHGECMERGRSERMRYVYNTRIVRRSQCKHISIYDYDSVCVYCDLCMVIAHACSMITIQLCTIITVHALTTANAWTTANV